MIKRRPYRSYKDTKSKWIGIIPEHWKVGPFKNLISIQNGADYKDVEADEGCPVIGSGGAFAFSSKAMYEGETVLLGRKGTIDKPLYYKGAFWAVDTMYWSKIPPSVNGRFAYYISTTIPFAMYATRTALPSMTKSTLGAHLVTYPEKAEQDQIARWLDREATRIDTLIAKKTRFIELLKEKRQAVITKAVTRGLDDSVEMKDSGLEWLPKVPAHWEVRRMASIFREAVRPGDPSLPILSISIHDGITDEELAAEDRDRRVTHIEDRSKYKRVKPNDIAYNMMRAWQGAFGAVAVEGLVSPAYVVAEPIEDLQTGYIEQLLRTPMAVEEMRRYSRGIADFRMRLYWEYFRDLKVCLPPVVEQKAILERIRRATTRIDVLVSKTERSIELLKEHRASLITAAVTGKIDVREAA